MSQRRGAAGERNIKVRCGALFRVVAEDVYLHLKI